MKTLDKPVSFQATNYLVKLLQLENKNWCTDLEQFIAKPSQGGISLNIKTHKKVVFTPQCTMKERKMISLNTEPKQHFSGENAYARDKTFHARDLAVPRANRR